ncbi:MAG: hypothetical protein P3W93_000935 [Thermus sp.]|nr:hypothetical protein [Thermus sp.]
MATLLFLLPFLVWPLGLAQTPGAPIPKPRPPEEPLVTPTLWVEVLFGGKPALGILVVLQPLAPNRLPSGPSVLRLTDGEGRASLPLSASPERLLISFHDRERGLRLSVPLTFALGTFSLGPYRFALSLAPP